MSSWRTITPTSPPLFVTVDKTKDYKFSCLIGFCLRVLGLWSGNAAEPLDDASGDNEDPWDKDGQDHEEADIPLQVMPHINDRCDAECQPLLRSKCKDTIGTPTSTGKKLCSSSKILKKLQLLFWFAVPSIFLILMIADLLVYLSSLWGRQADTLFIVSYSITYIPQLGIIPVMCLFVRIRSCFRKPSIRNRPPFVLTREYFVMRPYCLCSKNADLSERWCKDAIIFALLVFWPAVNIVIIIFNYFKFEAHTCSTFMVFSKMAACGGLGLYGCFCFVIFKLRQSHDAEFTQLVDIIESEDMSIEESKARVRQAFSDYRGFRNLVGTWTTFSTAVGVLGMLTQLYWNYNVYNSKEKIREQLVVMYAIMIWSEKLQFLVQPLFVIGGINADYLWRKFKRTLTERLHSADQTKTVDELLHHMKRIDTSFKWIKPTAAFTLVSFYLGMQMKNQNLNYWIGPSCNMTHWQM